jgi:hypothetical protein
LKACGCMRGSARAVRKSSLVISGNQGVVGDQKSMRNVNIPASAVARMLHSRCRCCLQGPCWAGLKMHYVGGRGSKSCSTAQPASHKHTHNTLCDADTVVLCRWWSFGSCRRLWRWCVWSPNGHKVSTVALKCATGGAHDAGSMRQQHHECLHTERHAWRTLLCCFVPVKGRPGLD